MNFRFANLLGAPYRGGNLLLHGQELLSPVGNRVSQVHLAHSTSRTLPFENLSQVRTLALSPDGQLLLSVDEQGRALLVARARGVLLHHFSFKGPVAAAQFSPDGRYLAAAVGRLVQVWHAPGFEKQLAPMRLHRTYGTCADAVTCLDWSADSRFIAAGSKDLTARVYSLNPIPGWTPPTLAGHKDALVGVFFASDETRRAAALAGQDPGLALYTVSRDGALLGWVLEELEEQPQQPQQAAAAAAAAAAAGGQQQQQERPPLARGAWRLGPKHYFLQRGARLSAAALHKPTGVLAAGFSNGLFELLQLPDFAPLQTLSASHERVSSVAFNGAGDWLALGCARLGQLLVWEWRSESYVLRQQGHSYDVACAAYSPDGAVVATGADDCKVKLFQLASGFCYATFAEHGAPVTALAFLPSGAAVLSASLDGTVRAYDLLRYRNFRTLTAPGAAAQFCSLAVEPAGEVVAAGTRDNDFSICVWSIKNGRVLDVLAGHEGPVVALAFSPTSPLLASASWDKTVRTWDVYDGKAQLEVLQHAHDVLALAWRPDGKLLASATLDGQIYLWDPADARLDGVIEGRRDVRGGRLAGDRRAAGNLAGGAAFTSLAFSADGALLLAGGRSRYVCVYDVAERVLLRRFQVTANRSLDGVLDQLNSRHLTDAGPLQLINHDDGADSDEELLPPGGNPAAASDLPGTGGGAAARRRPAARTRALALSPTGDSWAAATTEGLLLYALDPGLAFDPTDLAEALTPAAFHAALAGRAFGRALLVALRLGDAALLRHALLSVPPAQVAGVAAALPPLHLQAVLAAVAELLACSPHVEFLLSWAKALLVAHGPALEAAAGGGTSLRAALVGGGLGSSDAAAAARGGGGGGGGLVPVLRSLQQAVSRLHRDLAATAEANAYLLEYVCAAGRRVQEQQQQQQREQEEAAADDAGMRAAGGVAEEEEEEGDGAGAGAAAGKQKQQKKQKQKQKQKQQRQGRRAVAA